MYCFHQASVSLKRLRVFLSHEELDEDNVERPAITAMWVKWIHKQFKSGIKQMCHILWHVYFSMLCMFDSQSSSSPITVSTDRHKTALS